MLKSCQTPQVAALKRLIEHRAERQRTGRFFTEGIRFVRRALDSGRYPLDEAIFCSPLLTADSGRELLAALRQRGVPLTPTTEDVFRHLSLAESAQGIAAVCRSATRRLKSLEPEPVAVALDTIRSPGNLGTLLRTMEATGATTLFLLGDAVDPFDPRAVRATMGSLFGVHIVRTEPDAFDRWRVRHRVALVGTSPHGGDDFRAFDYPPRCVLWLGGERKGLSESQQASCDTLVRIPMRAPVDSLNVAVAGSVLLYDAFYRCRDSGGP